MADMKYKQIREGLDRVRHNVLDMMEQHGWAVMNIFGSETFPPYSYTVGLTKKGLPELIILGLDAQTGHHVLNGVAKKLVAGLKYSREEPLTEVFANHPAYVREIQESVAREHMKLAGEFFPEKIAGLQVFWPDRAGQFPWQEGFDKEMQLIQPILAAPLH